MSLRIDKCGKILLLLFVILVIAYPGYSQKPVLRKDNGIGIIKGIVQDSSSQEGINYSTITVFRQSDSAIVTGAISKADGEFIVDKVPEGLFKVKISYLGYIPLYISNVSIKAESPVIDLGLIKLHPKDLQADEIKVTADKDPVTYKVDKKVINMSQLPSASSGTASDALQNVPGVTVDAEGNVAFRGSQNFTLLVDGKPSVLSATELLRQLPASMIESIELITNPSAKYDPDGTSGIVNIILKKEKIGGMSGIINASAGINNKYSGDFLFNFKNDNLTYFFGADLYSRSFLPFSDFIRETYSSDTTFFAQPTMDRLIKPHGYALKAGMDYWFNPQSSISMSADFGNHNFERIFPSKTHEWTEPGNIDKYWLNQDDFLIDGLYGTVNLTHLQKFETKGHELTSNLFFNFWDGDLSGSMANYATNENYNVIIINPEKSRSSNDQIKNNIRGKVDYTRPIAENQKIETGLQADIIYGKQDYYYENLNNGQWEKNTDLSNDMDFRQNIYSSYLTYSTGLLGLDMQAGLRLEYYYRNLGQLTLNKDYRFEQWNLFPSLHFTKQIEGGHQFQLSYSRRVRRPNDRELNPFPDYVDQYYISHGNPELKPEFTDSYELNYRKSCEKMFFSIEGFYRHTYDLISRHLSLQPDNRILLSMKNQETDYSIGTDLSWNITIYEFLRLNVNASIYHNKLKETIDNVMTERSKMNFDGNATLLTFFSASTLLQTTLVYQGPRYVSEGEMKEFMMLNLTLRHDLFDKALTLTLSANDVLSTGKYEFINSRLNFKSYGYFQPEAPNVSLGISLKINNYRQKRAPERIDLDFGGGI